MDFQAYIHPAGQSLYHQQNPLHNLYEIGLSSASSIGIKWGIKPVAILVQMVLMYCNVIDNVIKNKKEFLLSPKKK